MSKSLAQAFFERLNEKDKRLYAGLRANELGYYGVSQVSQELGIHAHTVRSGQKQLAELCDTSDAGARIRRVGGGRKKRS